MADKHTVHCRNGGTVIIDGDRVEVQLSEPIVFQRKKWTRYFVPSEEARRTMMYGGPETRIASMLEEAFQAVPMVSYPEDD